MDIKADQEIPLSTGWTDEVGNPADAPADASTTFTSDNTESVVITTADDGLLVARATGQLAGPANIHSSTTWTDQAGGSHTTTGDDVLVPVAGDAERATIVFGEAREITPDAPAEAAPESTPDSEAPVEG